MLELRRRTVPRAAAQPPRARPLERGAARAIAPSAGTRSLAHALRIAPARAPGARARSVADGSANRAMASPPASVLPRGSRVTGHPMMAIWPEHSARRTAAHSGRRMVLSGNRMRSRWNCPEERVDHAARSHTSCSSDCPSKSLWKSFCLAACHSVASLAGPSTAMAANMAAGRGPRGPGRALLVLLLAGATLALPVNFGGGALQVDDDAVYPVCVEVSPSQRPRTRARCLKNPPLRSGVSLPSRAWRVLR
jgi:hypothetical protein